MLKHKLSAKKCWQLVFSALITVLFLFVVIRQRENLIDSVVVLAKAPPHLVAISTLLLVFSFVCAALSYRALAIKGLAFLELFRVEIASACATKLIPSGVGGMGVHGIYLHKRGHSVAQSALVVSANNLTGFLTHLLMLLVALASSNGNLPEISYRLPDAIWLAALPPAIILASLMVRPFRRLSGRALGQVLEAFSTYRKQPLKLVGASFYMALLLVANCGIIALSLSAASITLSVVGVFLVYSLGVLAGALLPTPGGLGGVEGGLYAALLAFGALPGPALTAVLAFRLMTFWVPLLFGLPFLLAFRRLFITKDKG